MHRRLRLGIAALQWLLLAFPVIEALIVPHRVSSSSSHRCVVLPRDERVQVRLSNNDKDDEGEEEIYFYDQRSRLFALMTATNTTNNGSSSTYYYLDDLTPPPINWARDSILFSKNPATKRNNALLKTWNRCRQYLPPIVTGAWKWRDAGIMDRNPLGAIYNMIVVRIPTMAIGVVYIQNLLDGHPLILDFGQGAYEMSPIVVFSVLALILA